MTPHPTAEALRRADAKSYERTLLAATSLARLVGNDRRVVREGRRWRCDCAFHAEHRQRMVIDDHGGRYRCLDCGAMGNAITYLMKTRNMTADEAVRRLAETAIAAIAAGAGLAVSIQEGQPPWWRRPPREPASESAAGDGLDDEPPF